jgi:lipopolysaccharide/colanic/teichoic acid biosynthesis glycosyltransferase
MKANIFNVLVKRSFDLVASLALLGFLSPILLALMIIQYVTHGSPIFYTSKRFVSANGEIKIIKFRTMVPDALSEKYDLENKYMRDGFLDIPLTSEVYTKLGRILERTQLVECLQLLPVLGGSMSLVGNRPLPAANIERLKKSNLNWVGRFNSPAGITGLAQIVGKYHLTPEERLSLESLYSDVFLRGNIVLCDVYIIYKTLLLLCFEKLAKKTEVENFVILHCLKKKNH